MNKSDLIENIAKKSVIVKKSDVKESVDILIHSISSALTKKNRIEIRGFGTFSSRFRPARLSRNPKTGTSITISSKFLLYFRPSKLLKEQLRN